MRECVAAVLGMMSPLFGIAPVDLCGDAHSSRETVCDAAHQRTPTFPFNRSWMQSAPERRRGLRRPKQRYGGYPS